MIWRKTFGIKLTVLINQELHTDLIQSFVFDDTNIRGEIVQLTKTHQEILRRGKYPKALAELLGEALSAAVLMSATLKQKGKVSIQLQSEGLIKLLLVQVTNTQKIRGMIDWREEDFVEKTSNDTKVQFKDLVESAQLAITLEPEKGKRYQGNVDLRGDNLSACFEEYFKRSEQIETTILLNSDENKSGGILIQKLPHSKKSIERESELLSWEHINILTKSTKLEELVSIPPMKLLFRLYHNEKIRVFEPKKVEFKCRCSRERCEDMVIGLGKAEIRDIMEHEKKIRN